MKKILFILTAFAVILNARIVLDTEGNKIEIPDKITYAMPIITPMVQIAAMLGNDDKIVSGSKIAAYYDKDFP